MSVSSSVVIMTKDELRAKEDAAFQRGVARGKFEASAKGQSERVARNCVNWQAGICDSCGVQWQGMEVGPDYKCPHFRARTGCSHER